MSSNHSIPGIPLQAEGAADSLPASVDTAEDRHADLRKAVDLSLSALAALGQSLAPQAAQAG